MNTLTERNITYDRSGNLLTLDRYDGSSGTTPSESLSYSYSGPKRSTWTYDAHANVTADPQGGLSIAWNAIDLPRTLTTGAGTGAASTQRGYLADGTLAQVSDGTTTRLYLGDIVFNKASNGTVTLESAGWEGGRLLPGSGSDKVLYTVTDHLGSVRVVKDGSGVIRQRFDYYPYGTVSYVWTNSSTTDSSEKRYRFGGKEIAGSSLTDLAGIGAAPDAPYLDFGARLYSPRTATWLSEDPLMEKYYGISPFVYCLGSPLNLIDSDGCSFTERSNQYITNYMESIDAAFWKSYNKILEYEAGLKNSHLSKGRIRLLNNRINKQSEIMTEMMEASIELWALRKSTQVYDIFEDRSIQSGGLMDLNGVTEFDVNSGFVLIRLNKTNVATISHELKHAFQFEQGETGFVISGQGTTYLHDYGDEVNAFKRGSYFGGESTPPTSYMNYPKDNRQLYKGLSQNSLQLIADKYGIIFRLNGKTYVGMKTPQIQ